MSNVSLTQLPAIPSFLLLSCLQKLYAPLPVMHVTAVQAKDKRKLGVFEAPCYRGKGRTGLRYIDTLSLRTDQPPSKWTLRGCALLCSID